MATQYDFSSGLDLSGLTTVTQVQLMQAINQLAPLSNIGGVIYDTTEPDIANNPRFTRYMWLDSTTKPPTQKFYNSDLGTWDPGSIANASITVEKLKVTPATIPCVSHLFDDAVVDAGLKDKVLVFDSSGEFITQLSRSSFMSGYTFDVNQIDLTSGGAVSTTKRYLRYNGSAMVFAAIDPAADLDASSISIDKIAKGSAGYLIRTNVGGSAVEYVSNDDSAGSGNLLAAGSLTTGINISKLKLSGTPYAQVRHDAAGTSLEYVIDPLIKVITFDPSTIAGGEVETDLGAHGIGSNLVDIIDIKLVWLGTYYGYHVNDVSKADILRVYDSGAPVYYQPALNVYIKNSDNHAYLTKKGGAATVSIIGNDGTTTTGLNWTTVRDYFDIRVTLVKFNRT